MIGALAAVLGACTGKASEADAASRGAIEATVDQYVAASNEGDAAALTELYAEDALLLPPDHEPVRGREAIGQFWEQGTDTGLEISTLRLEVNGDVAYLVGRYRLPPTEQEDADSGQYVLCLKRQADGAWKLTADIWNGSGASDERGAEGETGTPKTAIS
ncbi:MAG TPA: SgcJ/EcaC family oxidoreductase [Gemmatimonadales bacterium]|nr:SgcJ/EcaC family oxidoreductase [Gemmatimonadales bacterium]